ncbi:hypothetical protein [Thermus sediminis]|uniref:hypothetical protein n=1 Tax=Thermus sediminis TaxID=1761908 RepID=UPI001E627C4F|nr:hypothetical protein [Thermus sediminis]
MRPSGLQALRSRRLSTLLLVGGLSLIALAGILKVHPLSGVLPLLFALFSIGAYRSLAGETVREEVARRLGLESLPEAEREGLGPPLLKGEPEWGGELRGEVLGVPFRRLEVGVWGARRFGRVGYGFSGVLYVLALPRSLPDLHVAPRGFPTYPSPGASPPTQGRGGPLSWASWGFSPSPWSSLTGTSRASP